MPKIHNQILCQQHYDRGMELWNAYIIKRNSSVRFNENADFDEDKYASLPFDTIQSMANNGDSNAQCYLGVYYGNNGAIQKAVSWFEKSAKAGCPEAMTYLSFFLLNGANGCDKDLEQAGFWLQKASETNCSWKVAQLMIQYCLEKNTYSSMVDVIKWASIALDYVTEPEQQKEYAIQILNSLQALWSTEYAMREESPAQVDFQKMENLSLQSYVWYSFAYDLGARCANDDIENPAEILCQIGEAALIMNKPYAVATLEEAMAQGSDYAAVLLVPMAMEEAINYKQKMRTTAARSGPWLITDEIILPPIPEGMNKAAENYVEEYFPLIQRAAQDSSWHERQARSLYRLSFFYLLGLCCRRNINAAHDCLQKSANLGFSSAEKMLPRFKRKLFGWEYH